MSGRGLEITILELYGRALYDIAQVLESAGEAEKRMLRALEILRQLVPYEQCALLDAEAGSAPRILAIPAPSPDEKNQLTGKLVKLFGLLVEERAPVPGPPSTRLGEHLAVPLIGLGDVIGVLFVRRPEEGYVTRHVQALSVVAAQIAAYLMMLRARAEESERTRELEEARRAADTASRAKDEFLKLVSHELKTPLTVLKLALDSLKRIVLNDSVALRWVDKAVSAADRLTGLVEQLLDVSRMLAGKLRLEPEPFDLVELVGEVAERFRKGAAVEINLDLRGPLPGEWDRLRLDNVITNLLSNAVKYGLGRPIDVLANGADGKIRLVIRDRGIGIEREKQVRLFQRFERAVSARNFGGLGLGLWIVRQVVEAHGGSISLESKLSSGSTFTLELPTRSG